MFSGIVIHGDELGKKYGYPTANLDIKQEDLKLKSGVYAAYVVLKGKKYPAALAIKDRPWRVEVHLLDYAGQDFYGAYLEVEPVEKVGEMEKYEEEDALIEKIGKDIKKVRELINNH